MNNELANALSAVLYEGHLLYPHQGAPPGGSTERFSWGRVYPREEARRKQGKQPSAVRAEILLERGRASPELRIGFGFLQPIQKRIAALSVPMRQLLGGPDDSCARLAKVPIDEGMSQTWMEAVERQITLPIKGLPREMEMSFNFAEQCLRQPIIDDQGMVCALIETKQVALAGKIHAKCRRLNDRLVKISVSAANESLPPAPELGLPPEPLYRTLVASHFVFQAKGGDFVSLRDPPRAWRVFARECRNIGVWPVLVGDAGSGKRDAMLASAGILYDYPKAPPEEAHRPIEDQGTEDMLTLHVITNTEDDKCEIQLDEASLRLLNRLKEDGGGGDLWQREIRFSQPGAFSPTEPVDGVWVDGVELAAGDTVCLRPAGHEPIDLILAGKRAVINSLQKDDLGQVHLVLFLADQEGGRGSECAAGGQRFFYRANEVEPCGVAAQAS